MKDDYLEKLIERRPLAVVKGREGSAAAFIYRDDSRLETEPNLR